MGNYQKHNPQPKRKVSFYVPENQLKIYEKIAKEQMVSKNYLFNHWIKKMCMQYIKLTREAN